MAAEKVKKKGKSLFDEHPKQSSDLAAFVTKVKEKPAVYIGAAAFVLVCFLAGVLYRSHGLTVHREIDTEYAKALAKDDPKERLAALEPLLSRKGDAATMSEIVYVAGETAYWAKEYDKAKAAFERVQSEYADSPYVPDAVEGLGYIAEDHGDLDSAYSTYTGIAEKWPTSFAARRQPLNLGRVDEQRGNLAKAVESYREQTTVFPGSQVAQEAQAALDRLGKAHPELFAAAAADASKPEAPALSLEPSEGKLTPVAGAPGVPAAAPEGQPANSDGASPESPAENPAAAPAPAEVPAAAP